MKELINMKNKMIFILIVFFLLPICVSAKKEEVKLDKCIDGDTVSVIINGKSEKVRFIAVDAPEIDKEEPYSNEAKDFTCNLIKNGKKLYLEYDKNSDSKDKYDRIIAWVWSDNTLLQKEIVKNGYAKVAYLYDEYKYTSELEEFEQFAKENKLNIWSNEEYVKTENKSKESLPKSKKEILLERLNKSYNYIVIIIGMLLALITYYKRNKKSKLRKKR